jgi:hypothetical protein
LAQQGRRGDRDLQMARQESNQPGFGLETGNIVPGVSRRWRGSARGGAEGSWRVLTNAATGRGSRDEPELEGFNRKDI